LKIALIFSLGGIFGIVGIATSLIIEALFLVTTYKMF
jgi:hypothetical protein